MFMKILNCVFIFKTMINLLIKVDLPKVKIFHLKFYQRSLVLNKTKIPLLRVTFKIFILLFYISIFLCGSVVKNRLQCQSCQRCRFPPWVRKIRWRRAWQPTLVFLPRESHGQRSLAGYSPLGCKELDRTEET